jgi:hypothetical protein
MKSSFAAILGFVAAAQAGVSAPWNGSYTTTTYVTDYYTTYCSEATTFSVGTYTYTATASETVTITECPCTLTTTVPCTTSSSYVTPTTSVYVTPTTSIYVVPTTSSSVGSSSYVTYSQNTTSVSCTTSTISVLTTYCSEPTVVSYSSGSFSETYSVSTSGTATIPLTTVISATNTPVGPAPTTSVPVAFTGAASKLNTVVGIITAAAIAVLFL